MVLDAIKIEYHGDPAEIKDDSGYPLDLENTRTTARFVLVLVLKWFFSLVIRFVVRY